MVGTSSLFCLTQSFAMKASKVFWLLLFYFVMIQSVKLKFKSLALNAIKTIIDEYFSANWPEVDVISYGRKSEKSEEIVEQLLKLGNKTKAFKVLNNGRENFWSSRLNASSILVFDSMKIFKEFKNKIVWQTNNATRHRHIVQIFDAKAEDLAMIQADGFAVDTVSFLSDETEQSIDLITTFMFSPNACRTNKLLKINRFSRSKMRWENSNFFPEKYKNFHGCNLVLGEQNYRGIYQFYFIFHISTLFSKPLNFTFNFKFHEHQPQLFIDPEIDLHLHGDFHNHLIYNYVIGYISEIEMKKFFTPPGELYTPLEKMVLPFDSGAWIAIIVTLLFALVVIQVINRCPLRIQNFVFGSGNRAPTLSFVNIFLCGNQHIKPG